MKATDIQLAEEVTPTPNHIIERYRKTRDWRLFEKEYVYHNFSPAGKSWIDFGCGTGEITTQLACLGATRVIAIDVDSGLVELTKKRAMLDGVYDRVTVLCGDFRDLDPEPVDIFLAYAVLHHIPDRLNEAMPIIKSWIKPGGTFICVEPVSLSSSVEWLRNHSGLSLPPLDPGERKLTEADLRCIEDHFARSSRTYFRVLGRIEKLWPNVRRNARRLFRAVDRGLVVLPGVKLLAGTVILVGRVG